MGFISKIFRHSKKQQSKKPQPSVSTAKNQSIYTGSTGTPHLEPSLLPILPKQDHEKDDLPHALSQSDMGSFIRVQETNDLGLYLTNFSQSTDDYNTTMSSSNTSLQDALFSHFSDTQSEQTNYSELPFDDLYFYKKYQEAFNKPELFQVIAKEGSKHYSQLHPLTQKLISFAQFRVGISGSGNKSFLNEAAKNGNADALFMLGTYAERRGDFELACDFYFRAGSHVNSIMAFSHLLLFQNIQHPHYQKQQAISLLDDISQKGHAGACLALALYFEKQQQLVVASSFAERFTSSTDFLGYYQTGCILLKAGLSAKAFKHFGRVCKLNAYYTPALRKLGILYFLGIGTQENTTAAFAMIQEAARLGDEPANIILAQFYHHGIGCPVDLSKSMAIYQNYPNNIAARLSRGLLLQQKNPALAYQDFVSVIKFVPTPFDEAHWRVVSIQQEAAVRIAIWKLYGMGGVLRDRDSAIAALTKLSEECNNSGAYYALGCAYLDELNHEKAFECFLKGKEQSGECLYYLGKMLREGPHGCYSKKDAFGFFLKSAEMGYYPAYTQVGVYYYSGGLGTEGRDYGRAFQYFTAAAKYNNNDPVAIQYLADYIIKNNAQGVDTKHVYEQLNHAAGVENDPVAYRMLALVVHSGVHPSQTYYEKKGGPLLQLYHQAKEEAIKYRQDIKFRFALLCLWKAIELNDHGSGQYLNQFYPSMTRDDQMETIDCFRRVESGVPNKMSIAYANFLRVAENKPEALKKFIDIATFNDMTTSVGWNARIEAAKLVLSDHIGKATSKVVIFSWLNKMIEYYDGNGKNLFTPYILLAKCHDVELCSGCDKKVAAEFYKKGLRQQKLNDVPLEMFARVRLIDICYKQHDDRALDEHIHAAEALLTALPDSPEKRVWSADVYYYKGVISLHNGTIFNYREIAKTYLIRSEKLGHIMAALELGYLYGTMKSQEDEADKYFQKVEAKSKSISFKSRLTEFMVQDRVQYIHHANDYHREIVKMKLAAGIMYSFHNMERQATDWFLEISEHHLAQIMILYYTMKNVDARKPDNIRRLSNLMSSSEMQPLDYYGRMALSYGQLRLGQCYEFGHGVCINHVQALDYYNKAAAYLQNNEIYERLAEISSGDDDNVDLFRTLCHASRNNPDAMFKLAQYYHKNDLDEERAASYYLRAAMQGHVASCYYYAKYDILQRQSEMHLNAAARSKKAADLLRKAADRNHGPSYFELGQLEMSAGLHEEGLEDLKEAAFLKVGAACYRLGELYETGFIGVCYDKESLRITPKMETALRYYQDALRYEYIPAMIKIGSFYMHGWAVEQDLDQARAYYMNALNSRQCPEGLAEYALGCLEEFLAESKSSKNGSQYHYGKAFSWYQIALEMGNTSAKFKIGYFLLHGFVAVKDRKSDIEDSISILQDEKKNCNVQAIKELAKYYLGKGSEALAFQCWKDATLFEDPEAYEVIAECFEKGSLGQRVDSEEAAKYRLNAVESRKKAMETQHSTIGFKSDCSG